jgi:hypothetical protein
MFDPIWVVARFYWLCVKDAWRGSWDKANAWATLLGAVILWIGAESLGYHVIIPDTFPGAILLFVLCLGAAWVVIFAVRLIGAPARLYERAQVETRSLSAPVQFGLEATGEVVDQFISDGKKLDGRVHIKNVSSEPIEYGPAVLTATFQDDAPKIMNVKGGILRRDAKEHYKFEFDERAAVEGEGSVTFTALIPYGPPGRRIRKLQKTIEVHYVIRGGISFSKGAINRFDRDTLLPSSGSPSTPYP